MGRLVINNFGPISDVDIELKRFNVFVGRQSSGKSTIAKVISSCTWIEKECATTLSDRAVPDKDAFVSLIEKFHKVEGYFNERTRIEYESDIISLVYSYDSFELSLKDKYSYFRKKICYIPADRNMVVLPELQGFEFGNTNLRSFLFDWMSARENYDSAHKADILDLNVKYYYDGSQNRLKDWIEHKNGETYNISLACASSGLQSVIPLAIMLKYYSGKYFEDFDESKSFDVEKKNQQLYTDLFDDIFGDLIRKERPDVDSIDMMKIVIDRLNSLDIALLKPSRHFHAVYAQLVTPVSTVFIIEEPEQNLYPITQISLLDSLAEIYSDERRHMFTLTTHSPYIVNYLNVLLRSGKINDRDMAVFNVSDGELRDLMATDLDTGEVVVDTYVLSEPMEELFNVYESLQK